MAEKPTTAWRIILGLWVPVWLFFLVWPLGKNPAVWKDWIALMRSDADGRRAAAYGDEFYSFLRFCKGKLPEGSTFRLVGIDYASIAKVRAFYFLYPCLVSENAEYILVYETPGYWEENTREFALLAPGSFILRSSQPGAK